MRSLSLEFFTEALHIADILLRNRVKTVLDIGCGDGMLGYILSFFGINTTGTDIDCTRSRIPCIEGRSPEILEVIEDNSYDAVVSQHMIEHLHPQEQYRLLVEATRIARRLVVVVTPNRTYRWKQPDGIYDPDHKHILTVREMKDIMHILRLNNRIKKYKVYTINNFIYTSRKYYPVLSLLARTLDKIHGRPTMVAVAWV